MSEPAPLYIKVKGHILAQIRSGQWRTGERVPSENDLVERFKISRMTANRALRELSSEGYLKRVPGVGTFVQHQPVRASLIELRNIADEIAARGHTHSARVHLLRRMEATPELAQAFELDGAPELFHATIIHSESSIRVQLEERYVNPALAPGFLDQDFSRITPTAYLLATVPVVELEHTVRAVLPEPGQQLLLGIAPTQPCLHLHRRTWSEGKVVTVADFISPASRYALYSRYQTSPLGTLVQ